MGGASFAKKTAFNDVWIYAESAAVDKRYWGPEAGTSGPNIIAGQTYEPYWLRISTSAQWSPRSRAQAVVFDDQLYLLGGVGYDGEWNADLWKSVDGIVWTMVTNKALWIGRNNIRAVTHTNVVQGIWVVASVQEQFYNTMYTTDGVNFQFPANACALTDVDVQGLVSWRG